ncbi:MAG: hypothetical protein HYV09_24415 [Deltaproteobacteria bacterium]|nr:hypothetical protein [Deltaproteobacteria bacterium]
MSGTGFQGVVAGGANGAAGALRGFSFFFNTPLTVLVDAAPDDGSPSAAALALRLLAGIGRPRSGRVFVFDADPAADPALRRAIALLGDPVLLGAEDTADDPAGSARALAAVRDVPLTTVEPLLADTSSEGRRALADALANVERARLVLLSFPERYVDATARDAVLSRVRGAVERGAQAVIATRTLDQVLAFAPDDGAVGVILANGVAAAAAPAHALPWAVPADGLRTRAVRVVVSGAAKLAAELLADESVAKALTLIEPISSDEVRFHTRDPRALARAIGARAKEGLPVRALTVLGATAAEVLGGYR